MAPTRNTKAKTPTAGAGSADPARPLQSDAQAFRAIHGCWPLGFSFVLVVCPEWVSIDVGRWVVVVPVPVRAELQMPVHLIVD